QLQDLRPGLRHDPGRACRGEPDHHPAPLRHRLQVLPPGRSLGHGRVRVRGAARGDAPAVADLPQAGGLLRGAGARSVPLARWLTAALVGAGTLTVVFPFAWIALPSTASPCAVS